MREAAIRFFRFLRIFFLTPRERRLKREAKASGLFDPVYYCGAYGQIHKLFHRFPLRHYVVYGEGRGYHPNPDFSPRAYLRLNPDLASERNLSPFYHFLTSGRAEGRPWRALPEVEVLPLLPARGPGFERQGAQAPFAVVAHIYYPELWDEFADRLARLEIDHDLFVTLTWRGDETEALAARIRAGFPRAHVQMLENRGRDILPFLELINAGALDGYRAVCKIHTKKSPHRQDGDTWRQHLIEGVLPENELNALLEAYLADRTAAFWVADGQHYTDTRWWGSNFETTRRLLRGLEIEITPEDLSFPAGSIYWVKPLVIGMLRALHLTAARFEPEQGQVDGTLAHALERAMGSLAAAGGQRIVQTTQLLEDDEPLPLRPPGFVSAFYLPQFHPIPENDAWWGKGFTEWRGVATARPAFTGHGQPRLPADLGFYDLRLTEVMGEQAALARTAGIDAFCVYHYWFGGQRVLEAPLDGLLKRPDIAFPFYLCWANESWRRNWDGLSGKVLLEQSYAPGFGAALAESAVPYMRDPRYARPDGQRPRFVIYRPEDMPDPAAAVADMRAAWQKSGIGPVELGAVRFHVEGTHPVAADLFDFWVEMPPHGLVEGPDYLFGGPQGNLLGRDPLPGFEGLVYDYTRVVAKTLRPAYADRLPDTTIRGVMPGWDNSARRGLQAHIAYGANPATFRHWLIGLAAAGLDRSYRRELFLNAWNEWAEKAVLEPDLTYGRLYLDVVAELTVSPRHAPQG